jgi:hypothetical protein
MSLEATLARISHIDTLFAGPQAATATAAASPTSTATTSFATALQSALSPSATSAASATSSTIATTPTTSTTSTGAGQEIADVAQSQVGQTEQPPGSNDGPAIAEYRTATQGAGAGEPWCAYFASWAAKQAGEPLGTQGQGLGSVGAIWSWAQQNGRAIANGPGVTPAPGDLIVFGDQHVGIVKQVLSNGDIETVEGNYNNQVSNVIRSPTEATGYVQM